MDERLPERFWAKVAVSKNGCWMWTASLDTHGYGYFCLPRAEARARQASRRVAAHRFAYAALVGPIPAGLDLDHLCRVPACVNPAHLEPVTRRENLLRGAGFGGVLSEGAIPPQAKAVALRNAAKTHCPHGHAYTADNTYRDRHGYRKCRTCVLERVRRRSAVH